MANDCIGEEVQKLAASLPDGGVLLLENVRFYKEEEKNDPEFAKKLASVADLYVNDAFGTAHRAHASTEGVTKYLKPAVAGFLMQKVFVKVKLVHVLCFLISMYFIVENQYSFPFSSRKLLTMPSNLKFNFLESFWQYSFLLLTKSSHYLGT